MKLLPYFLLRLLPKWQYICPKCRKEVKPNSHDCPYCCEHFPSAVKVPLSFLKDTKKLEAYVHKHVFPRISEFERNYLTKYFTPIFTSGFETGDFSEWTENSGGTIVSSPVHHGTYAAHMAENSKFYKSISATSPCYARLYGQISALPANGVYRTFFGLDSLACPLNVVSCGIYNDNGTYKWYMCYDRAGTMTYVVAASPNPVADTFYCVELYWKKGASSDAECKLYIDGVEVCSASGFTGNWDINYWNVGTQQEIGMHGIVDCCVLDTSYIGVEGGATAKSFSDVGGGSDAFLNPYRAMPFSDTGHGAEGFNTPFRSMTFSDVGHGVDIFTLLRMLAFIDTGSGADVFAKEILGAIAKAFADAGVGTDTFSILFKALNFLDSGVGTDAFQTPYRAMGFSDVGHGVDYFALMRILAFIDSVLASDVFSIPFKALKFADIGSGIDVFALLRMLVFSDVGSGSDAFATLFRAMCFSDTGNGADAFTKWIIGEAIAKAFADMGLGADNWRGANLIEAPSVIVTADGKIILRISRGTKTKPDYLVL